MADKTSSQHRRRQSLLGPLSAALLALWSITAAAVEHSPVVAAVVAPTPPANHVVPNKAAPAGGAAIPVTAAALTTAAPSAPVAAAAAIPAAASTPGSAVTAPPPTTLAGLQHAVAVLQKQSVGVSTDVSLARLREQTAATQAQADRFVRAQMLAIARIDAALKPLSTVNNKPRRRLDAEMIRHRRALLVERAALEADLRAGRIAAAAADRIVTDVSQRRRSAFDSRTLDRTASPIEADFWTDLAVALPGDADRLAALGREAVDTAVDAPEPDAAISIVLTLAVALGLAIPLRRWLIRLIRHHVVAAPDKPSAGFRRVAIALATIVVGIVLPGLAALAVRLGLQWGGLLSPRAAALSNVLIVAVIWGSVVLNLTRQLAGGEHASDRLLTVSQTIAARASSLAWLVAFITGLGFVVSRINSVIGASLAATVAANCVFALAYAAVFGLILSALGDDREDGGDNGDAPERGAIVTLVALVLTAAIVVTVVAVLGGFTTLALLVATQVFWIGVLVASTYLVLRFADEALGELFQPGRRLAHFLISVVNLGQAAVDQIGVITSAVVQVLIVLGAISLALTPFGRNGDVVGARLAGAGAIHLGSLVVSPRSLAIGAGCLLLGFGLVHVVDRWLARRFLPVTRWDTGVRNSVATGIRYLGIGLVLLWALTAAGLGFSQIALIASALSVGIGFGLQQIVQNFVSGIILLIERPIKVGDLVNIGGIEGDVRNIRVRATEILQADRTTLIVPNSDLITKPVQNKTLGDPRGRVQLALTIDAATDASRAIELIAAVLKADAEVLSDPAPSVYIDSLTPGGSVNFVAFAYVASPRDILRVRSGLYLAAIKALVDAKVHFVGADGQVVVVEPGAAMRELASDLKDSFESIGREAAVPPIKSNTPA